MTAISSQYQNCDIILKTVKPDYFQEAKIKNEYLTVATYYRLVIPELLKDYDKCIYLDGDILVLQDLQQLYNNAEINDNYLLGVKAWNMYRESQLSQKLQTELGVPIVNSYINAGVLVINLQKMREDKFDQQLLKCVGKRYRYEDQDILNQQCYGHIGYLQEKYNVYSIFYNDPKNLSKFMDECPTLLSDQVKNTVILHFSGMYVKPWENRKCKGAKEWYIYLQKIQCVKELFDKSGYVLLKSLKDNWNDLLFFCNKFESVYIWGYTKKNELLKKMLLKKQINVAGFIDNDIKKQGKYDEGDEVIPVEGIKNKIKTGIVITSKNYLEAMKAQLTDIKFSLENVEQYDYLSRWYYMGLDPMYYKDELDDIICMYDIEVPSYCDSFLEKVRTLEKNEEWFIIANMHEFNSWIQK